MTYLELEREIAKITIAMMARNSQIGKDLISYLKTQLTTEAVVAVVIVSIERVIWFEPQAAMWSIENWIPADVRAEIQKVFLVHFYKQLIAKGFIPGKDFSIDADSKLLLNLPAKSAILSHSPLKV